MPPYTGTPHRSFSAIKPIAWYSDAKFLERAAEAVKNPANLDRSKSLLADAARSFSKPPSVLDFGGAAGIDLAALDAAGICVARYHVVDHPSVCQLGRDIWSGDDRITFSDDLPDRGRFDIVYSCSSLQYIENYAATLAAFTKYEPALVVLVRHPIGYFEFVREQIVPGGSLPQWVMDLDRIKSALSGYDVKETQIGVETLDVSNFDEKFRVAHTTDLVFERQVWELHGR